MSAIDTAVAAERATARQPRGLWTLASAELWERFSFYGVQVILAYYIYYSVTDGGLGLSDVEAFGIAGAYGGAVYLIQPVGAWLADRVIPARTLVLVGGAVIMAGHIALAFVPGLGGLLTGLCLIVLGTGALFPNILAMMNLLYDEHAPRRDFGFTLYYTGVLIGALIGPIATGFLQVAYGFHVAFSAAAIGMFIGLLGYVLGRNALPPGSRVVPNPLTSRTARAAIVVAVILVIVIALLIGFGVVTTANANTAVLIAAIAVSALYFVVMHRSDKVNSNERSRVLAYIPLFIVAVTFWSLVLQLFTTFAAYADTRVDLSLEFVSIPAAYISTFQTVTAIVLGPAIAVIGGQLIKRSATRLPSAVKLGIGFTFMTVTYVFFAVLAALFTDAVPLIFVIVGMVLLGITEVSFAPIFLSVSGTLAPRAFNAQMMALAGLSIAVGASLAGFMGQLSVSIAEQTYFWLMAAIAVVGAVVLFACRRPWAKLGIS